MYHMFHGCTSFSQNLASWNVSPGCDMSGMFSMCLRMYRFNVDAWQLSSVKDAHNLFDAEESDSDHSSERP